MLGASHIRLRVLEFEYRESIPLKFSRHEFNYYLCVTVYVLFIFYVTLQPGIGPIAVCNKYKIHNSGNRSFISVPSHGYLYRLIKLVYAWLQAAVGDRITHAYLDWHEKTPRTSGCAGITQSV
jgi:hypothetical protein